MASDRWACRDVERRHRRKADFHRPPGERSHRTNFRANGEGFRTAFLRPGPTLVTVDIHSLGLIPNESPIEPPLADIIIVEPLPSLVNLSSDVPMPGDQNPQPSCTAWAIGYALMTNLFFLENGWEIRPTNAHLNHIFSPAFIYNEAKRGLNDCSAVENHGMSLESAFNILTEKAAAHWM